MLHVSGFQRFLNFPLKKYQEKPEVQTNENRGKATSTREQRIRRKRCACKELQQQTTSTKPWKDGGVRLKQKVEEKEKDKNEHVTSSPQALKRSLDNQLIQSNT